MNIISIKNHNYLQETIKILKQGGLVIFPSDTVYGLLVDARNDTAVRKLVKFKNRPIGKAISVFVGDREMLAEYVKISHEQDTLMDQLLPGPFTVILPSLGKTSPLLESEKQTLGVRLPSYEPVISLTNLYGTPITATSANLGGRSPHYSIESLLADLPQYKQELIDLIIDAGKLPKNKPSTIVDLTADQVKILRKGDIISTDNRTFTTESPIQTKKIAGYLFDTYLKEESTKPTVLLITGDLGAGKTIFVKGIGQKLGVSNIISPTYVIYYEYDVDKKSKYNKFYHFDLYQIEDREEFKFLGIEKILEKNNIICIEWGDRAGEIIELLKDRARIITVDIKYLDLRKREISVSI